MKQNILIRFVTALAAMLLLYACTNENEQEMASIHKHLVMNCAFTGFDGEATRAGENYYGIANGDRMYLDFDGFKTYATYNISKGEWILDDCTDRTQGTVTAYFPNKLTSASSPLQGTGSYVNTYDAMTVNVTLKPLTGRIRFRGEPGKAVVVSGLRYYSSFSQSSYQFSTSTSSRSLTIASDGYTPYVYATFADKTELSITYDGDTYSKTFSSNVLQAGKSGYIDLKSHEIEIIPEFSIEGYDNDETIQPQNHEYVDLGLSVKWATCNVGASSPEDYGDYFGWGETALKDYYDWNNYKYCQGSYGSMTKYCTNSSFGTIDYKALLEPSDDVAHVKLGEKWRMPTEAEMTELREKCTWTWIAQNGVMGFRVTSRSNSNYIFLPAAGHYDDNLPDDAGVYGYYWSASVLESAPYAAWGVVFQSNNTLVNNFYRYYGLSVRPVYVEPKSETHEYVDLGLSVKWATCNVGASSPEDYGDYYAWGETEPKNYYDWSTYKWCKGSPTTMTKYCTNSFYGTVDNKTVLGPEDDVAHVKWGGNWRMPTPAEIDELIEMCTWTWTTQNGKNGYKVTSKSNGNSIFLPAAGIRDESSVIYSVGWIGDYLSSSLRESISNSAYDFAFDSSHVLYSSNSRCVGQSVRPVWSE